MSRANKIAAGLSQQQRVALRKAISWLERGGSAEVNGASIIKAALDETEPHNPISNFLVGVHGRNDFAYHPTDYDLLRMGRIQMVKMMTNTDHNVFAKLRQELGLELITRLFGSNFNTGGHPTPDDFVAEMEPAINQLKPHCSMFEIHNEPNHMHGIEGWGDTDEHAKDFNDWYLRTLKLFKSLFPDLLFGFPGLAVPHRDFEWIAICAEAIKKSDWLGVHCYWQNPTDTENNHLNDFWGLRFKYYNHEYPSTDIHITEAGNSNKQSGYQLDEQTMAKEIHDWMLEVSKHSYVKSAAPFIMSSPDPTWEKDGFTWRGEDGKLKEVVHVLGNRSW